MKLKPIKAALGSLAGILLALIIVAWVLPPWRHYRLTHEAQPIQATLENYRHQHGSYPRLLLEAGIAEPEELFYQRETDGTSYILWYGTTLGESVTYHSTNRQWNF